MCRIPLSQVFSSAAMRTREGHAVEEPKYLIAQIQANLAELFPGEEPFMINIYPGRDDPKYLARGLSLATKTSTGPVGGGLSEFLALHNLDLITSRAVNWNLDPNIEGAETAEDAREWKARFLAKTKAERERAERKKEEDERDLKEEERVWRQQAAEFEEAERLRLAKPKKE